MISIIIPAYGPQLFLEKCISSIYNSLNGLGLINEVIIVVDKINFNNHKEKLGKFKEIKYVITDRKLNPALARNLGSNKAKHEWLFFLDNDCELSGGYFKKFIRYLSYNQDEVCLQGEILPAKNETVPLEEDYDYRKSISKYLYKEKDKYCSKILSGANFIIKKDVFNNINGFNEKLSGAEDRDLGARLYLEGQKITYKDDLIVYHHYYPDLKHTIKRHIWHAKWNSLLYIKYPDVFKRPFRTRLVYSMGYLYKLCQDMLYFFGVIIVYNITFTKEYLIHKIKNGKR